MNTATSAAVVGQEHWTNKGDVKLFMWEKCIGSSAGKPAVLFVHGSSMASQPTFDLQVLHQNTMPALRELLKPIEQIYELGNFGRIYSGYVRESMGSSDIAKAKHESQRLQEVEELMQALVNANPQLAPLYSVFREEQRLVDTNSPIALADEMTSLFSGMQQRVLVLLDLTKTLFHTVFENESASGEQTRPQPQGASGDKADSHG